MANEPQTAILRFGAWAARMSEAARQEHTYFTASSSPQLHSHPFLAALEAHRLREWRLVLARRHNHKQRIKMQRAAARRSRRRVRLAPPLYQTPRLAQWRGPEQAAAIANAVRPDPFWRRAPPLRGEIADHLLADLAAIDAALEAQGMEPARTTQGGALTWWVQLDGYAGQADLGLFEVRLHPDSHVRVDGGDYCESGYCHPHVARDGHLCTGNFGGLREWLYRDGALELVFTTICQILRTYNPSSPYLSLGDLTRGDTREECRRCGSLVPADECLWVDEDPHCAECCHWCDGCERYVSLDSSLEEVEGHSYCESCAETLLEWCETCGRALLREDAARDQDDFPHCPDCCRRCSECGERVPTCDLEPVEQAGDEERQLYPACLPEQDREQGPEADDEAEAVPAAPAEAAGRAAGG